MIRLKIAEALKAKGKTFYWLAKEAGVTYPTVIRMANKEVKRIDLEVLEKIARALEVEPQQLLVMEDSKTPESEAS